MGIDASRVDWGGAEASQVYSTPLAERGTGKSHSSVSLDNLRLTATVEEGAHRGSSSAKKRLSDGR